MCQILGALQIAIISQVLQTLQMPKKRAPQPSKTDPICERRPLQILQTARVPSEDLPESLFFWLESTVDEIREIKISATRHEDQKRERWRTIGVTYDAPNGATLEELAHACADLVEHARKDPDLERVRFVAICNDGPARRISPRYFVDADGIEDITRGAKKRGAVDLEYNDVRVHARADAKAMMTIVIESAQAVQNMTQTLGESLARIWETQAEHAKIQGSSYAQVEIAKMDHSVRAQELAAETARSDRLLGVLGQVAPAIAAHISTRGDAGATVAAVTAPEPAADSPADVSVSTHGPKTAELAAILAELGDAKIPTIAEIAGADLWDPIWAALQDDTDLAIQEAAISAGLGAVRARVEAMPAAERTAKIPALLGLGAPAWRLHALITQ